jgi:hypothetical protein
MAEDKPPAHGGVRDRRHSEWHQTENPTVMATDWHATAGGKEVGEPIDAENEYSRARRCNRRVAKKNVILEHDVEFGLGRSVRISMSPRLARNRGVRRTRSRLVKIGRGRVPKRRKLSRYARSIDESALA